MSIFKGEHVKVGLRRILLLSTDLVINDEGFKGRLCVTSPWVPTQVIMTPAYTTNDSKTLRHLRGWECKFAQKSVTVA